MQRFVENYAGYLSESSMVQKHVAIMTEISAIVDRRSLMKVSALEQALACEQDHNTAVEQVKNLLDDKSIGFEDKIRVVMLYALRYEGIKNELPIFRAKLRDLAFSDAMADKIRLVDELLKFSGEKCRTGDVFSNKDWIAKTQSFLTRGLSDVKNIYTQHQPLISKIIDQAVKRTLKDADFPTIGFPAKKGYVFLRYLT
jgi:vacuolar protein sorting-associated protein 45